jgi:hypothetical protein
MTDATRNIVRQEWAFSDGSLAVMLSTVNPVTVTQLILIRTIVETVEQSGLCS